MAGLLSRPTPSPRYRHFSASCGGKVVVWGGTIEDFMKNRERLGSVIETFDPFLERWEQQPTTGAPPPGLYAGTCASIQDSLYTYGGFDGSSHQSGLYHLCTSAMEWRKLEERIPQDGPLSKTGCRMVQFNHSILVLFGGYGFPRAAIQPGSSFNKSQRFSDGRGWTNEFHLFHVKKGVWSSPTTTGTRPPPYSSFSLTKVVHNRAVLFGGGSSTEQYNDVYIIDLQAMSWTKMDKPEGAAWPVEREDHAACCLNYGQEHPQLLISGGTGKDAKTLGDAWLLSVATGTWREIILPEGMPSRWGHSLTATSLAPGLTEVTMFGGCTKYDPQPSGDKLPMIADTAVLTLVCLPSGEEWGLLRVGRGGELGSLERVGEKMAYSSKINLLQQVKPAQPASTHPQPMDKPPSPSPSPLHDSKETESLIRPGDTPTFPLLIRFPAKTAFINIPKQLGISYAMLGLLLLQDDSGARVAAIKAENQGNADLTNLAIFKEWMEGGGLQPVTWATLSGAMADIGQVALAEKINNRLN